MAAAKKRRFPYNARETAGGRTYAELPNGRELVFTGPAAAKAQAAARAQDAAQIPYAPVQPPGYDPTFDASAYDRAVEAAYAPLPMSARGSARDLASVEGDAGTPFAAPGTVTVGEGATDRALAPAPAPAHVPTLAEAQETRRAVAGPLTGGSEGLDLVYPTTADPAEEERRRKRPAPAALPKARVREGHDVHFREEEKPLDA